MDAEVDGMLGEMEDFPPDVMANGWQQACRTMAHRMFAVLGRHRGAAQLLLKAVPTGSKCNAPTGTQYRRTARLRLITPTRSPRIYDARALHLRIRDSTC